MMIDQKINRPYIKRLRSDPRTKAMFDGWAHQACMEAEARYPDIRSPHDAQKLAYFAARRALELAMTFVLDQDGEYKMVCEERDKAFEALIKQSEMLTPQQIMVKPL